MRKGQLNVRVEAELEAQFKGIAAERGQSSAYLQRQLLRWFVEYYQRAPDRAFAEIATALPVSQPSD